MPRANLPVIDVVALATEYRESHGLLVRIGFLSGWRPKPQ